MHPYLSTSIAEERRIDITRAADQDRILREAGVPTIVDSIRLSVGRSIVRLGKLVAGRRAWSIEPRPAAPAANAALKLAR